MKSKSNSKLESAAKRDGFASWRQALKAWKNCKAIMIHVDNDSINKRRDYFSNDEAIKKWVSGAARLAKLTDSKPLYVVCNETIEKVFGAEAVGL